MLQHRLMQDQQFHEMQADYGGWRTGCDRSSVGRAFRGVRVSREVWSAAAEAASPIFGSIMQREAALLGHYLPVLEPLTAADGVLDFRTSERTTPPFTVGALIVGLGLEPADSPRALKSALSSALVQHLADAHRYSSLSHLVVLYERSAHLDFRKSRAAARTMALRAHTQLEREAGLFVDVLLLDITACDDPQKLARKVRELLGQPAGLETETALQWEQITTSSIRSASADHLL